MSIRAQIPKLIKPYAKKQEGPFEKYQHFVVAPAMNSEKFNQNSKPKNDPYKAKKSLASSALKVNASLPSELQSSIDYELDSFIIDASNSSIVDSSERFLMKKFNAMIVSYFVDIPSLQVLYSPSHRITYSRSMGLVGFCFFSRGIIRTNYPTSHPSYHSSTDSTLSPIDCPVMLFPIWDYRETICGVIEVVRSPGSPEFTEDDEKIIKLFSHKFQMFSKFLLKSYGLEPMLLDIVSLQKMAQIIPLLSNKLESYFGCKKCEFWSLDRAQGKILKLQSKDHIEFDLNASGIPGEAMRSEIIINSPHASLHPMFNTNSDNNGDDPVLAIPVCEGTGLFVLCIVLRGPVDRNIFTLEDEVNLISLAPFIAMAISNSELYSVVESDYERSHAEREGLAALLEVAEILSGQLNIDRLTEIIMEKGRLLTKADRCSLFLVSPSRDRLITSFHRGLKNAIDIPINKGIAGKSATEGVIVNIADAYQDPIFDSSTDTETGYKTRSILSVPIFNNRGDVIGVTEMVNKIDLGSFSKWDSHLIQIFNVFCGISLENARLYHESVDMSQQLRSFFDVSFSLSKSESIHRILSDIIQNARRVIEAQRASLFLVDETAGVLTSFINDGGKLPPTLPLTAGIAGACAKSKESIVVNDVYADSRFNRAVDIGTGFKTTSLLVAPIVSSNGVILGVVEMINKSNGGFNQKDLQLLQSFATFASVSLENSRLKDIAEFGSVEIELPKYIGESEKLDHNVPTKLALTEDQKKTVSSLNFFSVEWKGIGQIKVLFSIFHRFGVLSRFKISNEMLYHFLHEIRSRYNDVPYHNWTHAVDVTQYVAYQITLARLENVFTPLELFALLVASICHDANHDGYNNVFNVRSETPLGILYKDQSVMETHHCSVAIQVMSKEECNLLHSLSSTDQKRMWNWIIKLILATDMAHHFKMVKENSLALDENRFALKTDECRLTAMQLILKVADISNVSRPFEIAEKWCDILLEEFFRQGDTEKANGQELSSPLNDRENVDKPKGQIGFYNFICIPLYQLAARVFSPLETNLNMVKSNLEVWKSMTVQTPPK